MELHIPNPKEYVSLYFTPEENYWNQNFLPKKNTRLKYLNTDLLNQSTLIQRQRNTLDSSVMYTVSTPRGYA